MQSKVNNNNKFHERLQAPSKIPMFTHHFSSHVNIFTLGRSDELAITSFAEFEQVI